MLVMTYEQEQRIIDNVGVVEKVYPGPYPIEIKLRSNSVGRGFSLSDASKQAIEESLQVEATVKIVGKGREDTPMGAIETAIRQIGESINQVY